MKKALVILSGGQDSTTCLAWAKKEFDAVISITYDYGQKNNVEIKQAQKIAAQLKVPNTVIDMNFFKIFNSSALINTTLNMDDSIKNKDIPASYVPNRNALFLSTAHAIAQNEEIEHIVIGTTKEDSNSHPDASEEFIQGLHKLLNESSESSIALYTPLITLSKPEVFQFATDLGVLDLVIDESHTCYENDHSQKHDWGYGCGKCLACEIRKKAWVKYKANAQL